MEDLSGRCQLSQHPVNRKGRQMKRQKRQEMAFSHPSACFDMSTGLGAWLSKPLWNQLMSSIIKAFPREAIFPGLPPQYERQNFYKVDARHSMSLALCYKGLRNSLGKGKPLWLPLAKWGYSQNTCQVIAMTIDKSIELSPYACLLKLSILYRIWCIN